MAILTTEQLINIFSSYQKSFGSDFCEDAGNLIDCLYVDGYSSADATKIVNSPEATAAWEFIIADENTN